MAIITDIEPGGPAHPIAPGGGGPVDPGYGVELPPVVDNGLPGRPGVWPPQRPTYPVDPDYGLPTRPGVWPNPPNLGGGHPGHPLPPVPVYPSHPIYLPPNVPGHPIELPPGAVWPPLPPALDGEKVLAFVWIVGVGYRWAVLDPGATVDNSLPKPSKPPGHVANPIQPTPQPKG